MTAYTFTPADADTLLALRDDVYRLYRLCFAAPPYYEGEEKIARFTDWLFDQNMAEVGVRAIVARHGETVAGVIYGWPTLSEVPEQPFYAKVYSAVAPASMYLLGVPALEVVELMVDPAHRRQGLGRGLLAGLIDGHSRAWLATHPEAPARMLYEATGWTAIGEYRNDGGSPVVIMSWSSARR